MRPSLRQIRDRKMVQWALAYAGGVWLLFQGMEVLETPLGLTPTAYYGVGLLAAIGLPVVLVLAWYHGEQGRQRVSGPELVIIGALLAIGGTVLGATLRPPTDPLPVTVTYPGDGLESLDRRVVAVLPFANLSPVPGEHAYFVDGIHDEVISRLSKIGALRVISRTSVMSYREPERNLREIGGELGAGTILEGTVRRAGDRILVTAQLIDAGRDQHLWTERFERVLSVENVFAIQAEIANRVAAALEAELSAEEAGRLQDRPTGNLKAYEFYLLGMGARRRGFPEREVRHAIAMYEQAIEIDPAFAEALAQLSRVHDDMIWYVYDRSDAREAAVRETLDRARQLKPDAVDVLHATGTFHYHRARYDSALHWLDRARALEPHNSEVIGDLGYVRRRQGRYAEAVTFMERALETDPRSAAIAFGLGQTHTILRRCDLGMDRMRRAMSLQPSWPRPPAYLAWFHVSCEGDLGGARRTLEGSLPLLIDPADDAYFPLNAFLVDLYDRRYDQALARLADIEHFSTQFSYLPAPYLRGEIYLLQDRREAALEAFDSARVILERKVREQPTEERLRGALAMTYAYLGERRAALDEARAGVNLMLGRDQYKLLYRQEDLAWVHAVLGDHQEAASHFERLLRDPGYFTVHVLRLDPRLHGLRDSGAVDGLLVPGA
jgi:TolB-like protein/Flp pilus assembly protein TadD